MSRKHFAVFLTQCLVFFGAALFVQSDSSAITYTTNYMTSWSGCNCSGNPLSYTDDQIRKFNNIMAGLGHTRLRGFGNQSVYATDLIEDRDFNGEDHRYSDDGIMYVYSGHGNAPVYNEEWGQTFVAPMCQAVNGESCQFDAENARLGEQISSYASPHPGKLQFLMFLTCMSVHTSPHDQWIQTAWFGLQYIMGYRGYSADSSLTDEVADDWAEEAYGKGKTFKAAWMWAIEDWWIDDTGSVWAPGDTLDKARQRRDTLNKTWPLRPASEVAVTSAWSWHEG